MACDKQNIQKYTNDAIEVAVMADLSKFFRA